jgi:hypothetical protein
MISGGKLPSTLSWCRDAHVVADVRHEQLVAEPLHLWLVGDVAGKAADGAAAGGTCPRSGRSLLDCCRSPVAGRDRASRRRRQADQLATHARTAGHHRELPAKRRHSRPPRGQPPLYSACQTARAPGEPAVPASAVPCSPQACLRAVGGEGRQRADHRARIVRAHDGRDRRRGVGLLDALRRVRE